MEIWAGRALAAALVLAALTGAPRPAGACGGFFCDGAVVQPPVQSAERIVFVQEGTRTTAIVQIFYQGDPADFSWVVPVVSAPTLGTADASVFDALDQATAPRYQFLLDTSTVSSGGGGGGCIMASDDAAAGELSAPPFTADGGVAAMDGGVTVVGSASIGPFETVTLRSDDPAALRTWLTDNGYAIPANAAPLIAYYVERDHYWVALKLRADANVFALDPLSITYEGEACIPVLLTQIATVPVLDVIAWFIGDEPVRSANYANLPFDFQSVRTTSFGGLDYRTRVQQQVDDRGGHAFVTELSAPTDSVQTFSADADALLARGAWVTRLYTTLRAEDMTLDPMFVADPAVPDQTNVHVIDLRTPPEPEGFDGCAAAPATPRLLGLVLPLAAVATFTALRRRRPR